MLTPSKEAQTTAVTVRSEAGALVSRLEALVQHLRMTAFHLHGDEPPPSGPASVAPTSGTAPPVMTSVNAAHEQVGYISDLVHSIMTRL